MDGIRIPKEIADEEGVPDDLDSALVGPYRFPSPIRRRAAARFYLLGALLAALGGLADLATGLWAVSAGFLVIAYLHNRAAWPLLIEQEEALSSAAARVPFAVGHASAALGFSGLASRPVWNVVLYSAEEPPVQRALVRLDAAIGKQIDHTYMEDLDPPG